VFAHFGCLRIAPPGPKIGRTNNIENYILAVIKLNNTACNT